MQLAWSGSSIQYKVSYKKAGGAWKSVASYDNSADIVVDDVVYDVIVTDIFGASDSISYSVQGKTTPPDVTNIQL